MTINELEKMVNEKKLHCFDESFELWEKQGFFKELVKAENNLIKCGYSVNLTWLDDCNCVEFTLYKGVDPSTKKFVTLFNGGAFSWRQLQIIAVMLCSALGIKYEY